MVDHKSKIYRVYLDEGGKEVNCVCVIYQRRRHWYGYRSGKRLSQVERRIWSNDQKPKKPGNVVKAVIAKAMERRHDLAS